MPVIRTELRKGQTEIHQRYNQGALQDKKFGYFVRSDEIRELLTAAVFFRFDDFSMSQFLSGSVNQGQILCCCLFSLIMSMKGVDFFQLLMRKIVEYPGEKESCFHRNDNCIAMPKIVSQNNLKCLSCEIRDPFFLKAQFMQVCNTLFMLCEGRMQRRI